MKTYSGKKLRKAQAALALVIFIVPTYCFSQGLKFDLLDGNDCRLFCDSTRQGLRLGQDSALLLPTFSYMRHSYEIDDENGLLSTQSYYLSRSELNENGQYRVFQLSDAALSRSEFSGRSDWSTSKRATLGKSATGGRGGKGLFNFDIPVKFPKVLSSLVGEGGPGLLVTGNYRVIFKLDRNYVTGVSSNVGINRQGTPSFQTQQEYNMFITGNVGSKLFVHMKTDKRANQYNQRLDLSDRIQIRYKGNEEDLVQSIEAGNTNLSLSGTQFAGFSQSVQGLFGLKADGQLGGVRWTAITSQQKGNSQSKTFRAGAEAATVRLRDKDYLRYTYFDLGRDSAAKPESNNGLPAFTDEFAPGDTLVGDPEFFMAELFNPQIQNQLPKGRCYVNPLDTADTVTNPAGEAADGYFNKLSPDRYQLRRDSFYVRFNFPLNSSDIIGVAMRVYRAATGRIDTFGYADTTRRGPTDTLNYVLKLIKRSNPSDQNITFYYEWKNVYDLRARDIDREGFAVDLFEGAIGTESDPTRKNFQGELGTGAIRYLRLLGLDRVNNTTGKGPPEDNPDNIIDLNRTVVDEERGYIIFPDRYPFNNKVSYTGSPGDTLAERIPAAYGDNPTQALNDSRYFLEILTRSRLADFSLGQVDILESSEDVRLNGQRLVRGQDYTIDYQLGQIHFNNSQVTDPNADVQITYEYTPFLSAEKKNLFGLRTEYAPNEQFRIGSTVLYRTASTIDQKPRIGEEPSRALLLDANFGYSGQSNLLTRLVSKLPGVTGAAASTFQLEGEIARSLPNPNTLGRAFIDDFEGSRDFNNLGIRRGIWTLASAPSVRNQSERGRMAWFVPDGKIFDPRNAGKPIDRFRVLEIFPDRDVPSRDERTDVLELRYFPKQDSAGFANPASWAGIMRWLAAGLQNQQETQQLEFWVALDSGKPAPRLHFDFGRIIEDINGDGEWQTEDSARIGTVDPQKDVGLDGLPNEREPGYHPDTLPDPNRDDWLAPGRSGNDPVSLDHINGTEKNSSDPERLSRPDNEDLNNNGNSGENSYFSFSIDLGDTTQFMVPGSFRVNQYKDGTGQVVPRPNESRLIYWRQIRIPLKDSTLSSAVFSKVGNPSWSNVEYVRVWTDGLPDTGTARLRFASLDFVGNRWKELGVFDDSLKPATDSQKVRVSVINSQEHPAYRADPPPGVSEVLNRVTNLREREQSLVVTYENVQPGNKGLIQRVLLGGAEDYSGYRTMKMLVHGDRKIGNADNLSDSLLFFFRFGSGTQNDPNSFYEYRVFLKPGWDLGNTVNLDFNRLTNLKNVLNKSRREAGITSGVGDTTDGNYRVRGNPSLAAVRWYVMGMENLDSLQAASGEVWTDELLLTDVRQDAGTAGRFQLSTQLADFGSINVSASRVGATFRSLTGGGESGTLSYNRSASTNEALNFSGNFQVHKLLPRFLPITSLPVLISWSRSRSTPRLRTGSDIVLTDEFSEAERSEQVRRGFTVTPSLRRETKNWLWNLTFNRMGGGVTYSYFRGTNPFTRLSEERSYTASMSYDLSPRKTLGFKPFGWLPSFWFLKKVEKSEFAPLPATFNVSGQVSRTQRVSVQNDALGTRVSSYVRDFNGTLASSFRIFPNLTADYNFSTRRDISDAKNLVFSASPRRFKLGLELERNQSFRSTYNPGLFSFAETRLTFSSAYREAGGLAVSSDGKRSINASNGYGANVNFSLTRLLGTPKPPSPEDQAQKIEKKTVQAAEKKLGQQPRPDSLRRADSLARAAEEAIPAEIRFRQSLERFIPLPVPALGFLFPRLGPPPAPKDTVKIAAPDGAAKNRQARRDSLFRISGDSLAARKKADSARLVSAPPDSAKKPAPPLPKLQGSGEIFLLSDGLNLLRGLAARVDPVQFTYNHANQISRQGLLDRPSLAFQFGLTNLLGEEGQSGAADGSRNSDNYTARSGFNLGSGIRTNAGYAKNISRSFSSSGTARQEAETFPDLTLTVSGLEQRVGILKKFLPAGSLSSNYQKQTATNFDVATGRANTITTSKNHSPLISVSATFFRGLSANFSYRKGLQTSKSRGLGNNFVVTETKENGFVFTTRYSFIAPRGIRLPFLHGIRLSSSLNTNLSLQSSRRVTRGQTGISYDVSNLSIAPSMTYSFSTQVDGGLTVQWTDQKNNIDKRTTKVRSAVFSVDLKF